MDHGCLYNQFYLKINILKLTSIAVFNFYLNQIGAGYNLCNYGIAGDFSNFRISVELGRDWANGLK